MHMHTHTSAGSTTCWHTYVNIGKVWLLNSNRVENLWEQLNPYTNRRPMCIPSLTTSEELRAQRYEIVRKINSFSILLDYCWISCYIIVY